MDGTPQHTVVLDERQQAHACAALVGEREWVERTRTVVGPLLLWSPTQADGFAPTQT